MTKRPPRTPVNPRSRTGPGPSPSRAARPQAKGPGKRARAAPGSAVLGAERPVAAKVKKAGEALTPSRRPAATASVPAGAAQPREWQVEADRAGQRIDNFLLGRLKGVPRTLIYRLLRKGAVRIDGQRAKPDARLDGGETVWVPAIRTASVEAPLLPDADKLAWLRERFLFEDAGLIVLDKPPGLACHGGSGLSFGAIEALRALEPHGSFELVHRLDRDTSGLLLIARKRAVLNAIQSQIRDGQIDKRYLLLVAGQVERKQFEVNAPLLKNTLSSGERMVRVDPAGKPSLTRFRVVEKFAHATLLEAELLTGRTHQIRVHARHAGHPIIGDPKYGDSALDQQLPAAARTRMWLHSWRLNLALDGQPRRFEAPEPEELKQLRVLLRMPAIS